MKYIISVKIIKNGMDVIVMGLLDDIMVYLIFCGMSLVDEFADAFDVYCNASSTFVI